MKTSSLGASPPEVTVIVCTRNRSTILADCCEAALAVDYPEDRFEILIVDNMSTDDTPEVARGVQERHPGRVRIVVEEEMGLQAARNAGVREAEGEILAFLDDDAFPEKDWLRSLVSALEKDDVLAVGGPVEPLYASALPGWVSQRFLPYLTVWDLGGEDVELGYNEYPRGANMAFRREAFDRFGAFTHFLDRRGKSLLSCGETEFCLRVERGGGKLLYTPGARVQHRVEGGRLTPEWMVARFAAQGRSEAILEWQHLGLEGLKIGFKRSLRNARESKQDPDPIFRRCQWGTFRGYLRGVLDAIFSVPRYAPGQEAGSLAAWAPFR